MRASQLLLGLIPLLGLSELGLHQYFAQRAPGFPDYAALAPKLLELKRPGVPVVVSPSWAEPLVRQAAPAAFPLAELARSDDRGFAQFLEVSLLGAQAESLQAWPQRERQQEGAFELRIYDNPGFEMSFFDFVGAVEAQKVEVWSEQTGELARCPLVERRRASTGGLHGPVARPRQRYECADGGMVSVSLIEDQAYKPRRCLLVDSPVGGRIVLRFRAVPQSQRLVGFAGFSYFLGRDSQTSPVELSVRQGTQRLGQFRAIAARGWARFELPRAATEGEVEVSVQRTQAQPGDFCFALEAR